MILLTSSVASHLLLTFPIRLQLWQLEKMLLASTAADHFRGCVPPSHDYLDRLRLHILATKPRSWIDVSILWGWVNDSRCIGMLMEDFPRCCGILLLRLPWLIIISKRSRPEFTLLVAWMRKDTMQLVCFSWRPSCILGCMLQGKWLWRGKGDLVNGRTSQVTRATYSPIG
jgi:hypothetical protein